MPVNQPSQKLCLSWQLCKCFSLWSHFTSCNRSCSFRFGTQCRSTLVTQRKTDRPRYIGSKRQHHIQGVQRCALATFIMLTHHRRRRVAGEGRRVVASPCPRSTARLQRSPIGRVESFRSWLSHLFCGRPGGRRHERSGGQLSDTLMWSWRAMFAGVTSSSRAACPNTEMSRRDRRWYCPL